MAHLLASSKGPPSSLVFIHSEEAPLTLIQVTSDGGSSRLQVTEKLIRDFIEHDFQVLLYFTRSFCLKRVLWG